MENKSIKTNFTIEDILFIPIEIYEEKKFYNFLINPEEKGFSLYAIRLNNNLCECLPYQMLFSQGTTVRYN